MAPHTWRSPFSSDRRYSRAGSFPAPVSKKRTAGTNHAYNTNAILATARFRAVETRIPLQPLWREFPDELHVDESGICSECRQLTKFSSQAGGAAVRLGPPKQSGGDKTERWTGM